MCVCVDIGLKGIIGLKTTYLFRLCYQGWESHQDCCKLSWNHNLDWKVLENERVNILWKVYSKLDQWIMQFQIFDWLSIRGIRAIIQ